MKIGHAFCDIKINNFELKKNDATFSTVASKLRYAA